MNYAKIILTSTLGGIQRDRENLLNGAESLPDTPNFLRFNDEDIKMALEGLAKREQEVLDALIVLNNSIKD